MDGQTCPIEESWVKKSAAVADIIYNPAQKPLLKLAELLNKKYMNWLGMLLYQGVEAFEIWTEQSAPVETMKKALIESIHI